MRSATLMTSEKRAGRLIFSFLAVIGLGLLFHWSFLFMKSDSAPKFAVIFVALVNGVAGIWLFYLTLNNLVNQAPLRIRKVLLPYVFILPAFLILLIFIIYPAIRTGYISFFDYTRGSEKPVNFGLQNYLLIFSNKKILIAFRNNLLWLIFVPTLSVTFGLIIAVLVDRIRWERLAKSLIFLPMAISFVGASVIWRFVYHMSFYGNQIGILNAFMTALGFKPVGWLRVEPWNNLLLMVIMIWLQTGFAMVILSSAVKSVPSSLFEAARIDGANEFRIFFQIIIPTLRGTILTVFTTLVILVLKVFDIVFVMTSGQFNTDVVANMMFNQMFKAGNYGSGASLAVILLLAVMPIMIYNVRTLKQK